MLLLHSSLLFPDATFIYLVVISFLVFLVLAVVMIEFSDSKVGVARRQVTWVLESPQSFNVWYHISMLVLVLFAVVFYLMEFSADLMSVAAHCAVPFIRIRKVRGIGLTYFSGITLLLVAPIFLLGIDALFFSGAGMSYLRPLFAEMVSTLQFTPYELLWGVINGPCMHSVYFLVAKSALIFFVFIGLVKYITRIDISPSSGPGSHSFTYQVVHFVTLSFLFIWFCVNTVVLLLAMSYQFGLAPVLLTSFVMIMTIARLWMSRSYTGTGSKPWSSVLTRVLNVLLFPVLFVVYVYLSLAYSQLASVNTDSAWNFVLTVPFLTKPIYFPWLEVLVFSLTVVGLFWLRVVLLGNRDFSLFAMIYRTIPKVNLRATYLIMLLALFTTWVFITVIVLVILGYAVLSVIDPVTATSTLVVPTSPLFSPPLVSVLEPLSIVEVVPVTSPYVTIDNVDSVTTNLPILPPTHDS